MPFYQSKTDDALPVSVRTGSVSAVVEVLESSHGGRRSSGCGSENQYPSSSSPNLHFGIALTGQVNLKPRGGDGGGCGMPKAAPCLLIETTLARKKVASPDCSDV